MNVRPLLTFGRLLNLYVGGQFKEVYCQSCSSEIPEGEVVVLSRNPDLDDPTVMLGSTYCGNKKTPSCYEIGMGNIMAIETPHVLFPRRLSWFEAQHNISMGRIVDYGLEKIVERV